MGRCNPRRVFPINMYGYHRSSNTQTATKNTNASRPQCKLRQADRRLHLVIIVKEPQVTYGSCSQIMSYIFNMLICVVMILLDNLLQYLLFIAMIDLSGTCGTTVSLICYALVMFMIYP
jgi:hypothetical protein